MELQADPELLDPAFLRATPMLSMWQDWAQECAFIRQPVIEMTAAITTFSAIMGASYRGPTLAVAPLITLILAPPAGGKDFSQGMAEEFMKATGNGARLSAAKWGSASGLQTELEQCSERFAIHDEFAHTLEALAKPNCPSYKTELLSLVRATYTGRNWNGTALKDGKSNIIENPRLALYASAQPHTFWNSVSPQLIFDGTLSRILVVTAWTSGGRRGPGFRLKKTAESIPPAMLAFVKEALAGKTWENGSPDDIAKTPKTEHVIPWANHETEVEFCTMAEEYGKKSEGFFLRNEPIAAALIGRSAERVIRLAAVYAWSEKPTGIAVSVEGLRWARKLVDCSDRATLGAMCDINPTSDKSHMERMVNNYMRHISASGKDGMSSSLLMGKTRYGLRNHAEIVKTLVAGGHICVKQGKRGGQYFHWIGGRTEQDPVEEQEDLCEQTNSQH